VQAHVLRHRDDGLEGSRAGPEGLRDAEEGADKGLEAADLGIRVLHVDEFVDSHGEVVWMEVDIEQVGVWKIGVGLVDAGNGAKVGVG